MENHRRNNSSGDKFSFPIFPPPVEDHGGGGSSSFEFGCTTPSSPNSPADHLFFNGRLLPHAFPCQPSSNTFSFSRSTSITSSASSKDSFMSSRSNSTNSRSSSCSSARTSTSAEATSERKLLTQGKVPNKTTSVARDRYGGKKPVLTPHYGSSQRWQFITLAPPLKHPQGSSRTRKVHQSGGEREDLKTNKKQSKDWTGTWSGWRFFRSFVSACKECHAIKPSPRKYHHPKN